MHTRMNMRVECLEQHMISPYVLLCFQLVMLIIGLPPSGVHLERPPPPPQDIKILGRKEHAEDQTRRRVGELREPNGQRGAHP